MAQAIESQNSESKHPACKGPIYAPTAEGLSKMMSIQSFGQDAASYNDAMDATSAVLGAGAIIATSTGFLPLAAVLGAMGTAVYAVQTLAGALDGLLPSEMTALDIDYGANVFLEDDEKLTGTWENAQLMTRSKGFNAGKAALSGVLEVSNAKALGGLNTSWMSKFSKAPVSEQVSKLQDVSVSQFTDIIIDESTEGSDIAKIPPCDYGPTDITDEMWSKAQFIDADNANVIMTAHGHYKVIGTGKAFFEVEPIKEKFGGHTIIKNYGILVNPIEITIDPASYRGEPGDVVVFTASIENANHDDVAWSISPQGRHQYTISSDGHGTSIITIRTSEYPEDYPATVRVESTSSTGLRFYSDAPPRFAEALLGGEHANVEIDPNYVCVKPGQDQIFTATVDGSRNDKITWTATGGTINSQGVFTAGDEPGNYEVTATSQADPMAYATNVVTVGSCLCMNSFDLSDLGGNKALSVHSDPRIDAETIPFVALGIDRAGLNARIIREGDLLDGSLAEIQVFASESMQRDRLERASIRIIFPKDAGPMPGETGNFAVELLIHVMTEKYSSGDNFVAESVPITVHLEEFSQGEEPHEAYIKGNFESPVQGQYTRLIYDGRVDPFEEAMLSQYGTPDGSTNMHVAVEFEGEFTRLNLLGHLDDIGDDDAIKELLEISDRPGRDKWARRPGRFIGCDIEP